ncbi:MAG: mannosyltransferase family protein [Chthoniobacterales bacterium]
MSATRVRAFVRAEREILFAFVFSRLLVWAVAWMSFHGFRHGKFSSEPTGEALWNLLFRWDAGWYGAIVRSGYDYAPGQESRAAFFPLYPLCLRALCWLTGASTPLAGFLLSNLFLLGSAILLHRLVTIDFPQPSRVPARTVWLLLLTPVTFFHSAVYTESLFLFLSLGAFLAARKQNWAIAGVAGALLSATRANGILIALPLFWEAAVEAWRRPDFRWARTLRACAWLLLVPLGLAGFCVYLYFRFGDALAFVHATAAWDRGLTTPWRAIANTFGYSSFYVRLFLATEAIALATFVCGFRVPLRMSYQIYAGVMLLLLVCNTLLESLPRYVSVLFPLQLTLAALTVKSEGLYFALLGTSAAFLAMCVGLFVGGYWMT